jgi:hypothetical protein
VEESSRGFIPSAILTQLEGLKQTMETQRQPISWSNFETMAFQTQSMFCFTDVGSVKGTHSELHYKSADKLLLSSDATLLPGKIGNSF